MGDIIRQHQGLNFHLYADDTQPYIAFDHQNILHALASIHAAIADIEDWLLLNMLKVQNYQLKTDLSIIGSHQQLSKLNLPLVLHIDESNIITEEAVTNLGVIIDRYLKLDANVNKIFKAYMYHLWNISKIHCFLTTEACKLLVHTLVTSCLDYCNSLLYGSTILQCNAFSYYKTVLHALSAKFEVLPHTPNLKGLHWLPIHARTKFKLLTPC